MRWLLLSVIGFACAAGTVRTWPEDEPVATGLFGPAAAAPTLLWIPYLLVKHRGCVTARTHRPAHPSGGSEGPGQARRTPYGTDPQGAGWQLDRVRPVFVRRRRPAPCCVVAARKNVPS